ncbi:pyridoxamine 5'-phosphate oxidase family protein [Microlunatus speluncae]|uniref:pyridoxamine 5'-phosphate oxidase family protein n=1 Tax=Microlunatus speluncae TaxID=2594267 RepID=UPI001375B68C|nr:pyridoxamine 5'-phosphate oxidase family protein [Microlunatus speluncae]
MLHEIAVPPASPARKIQGYGMPEDDTSLLSWDFVVARMEAARHFWLTTTFPDGRPHAVPVWGLWHGNRLHFEGRPQAAWARNLIRDPRAVVHPPEPEQVVSVEGRARIIEDDDLTDQEWDDLDGRFQQKYATDSGSPYWCLEPTKVIAWDGGLLDTMTCWTGW